MKGVNDNDTMEDMISFSIGHYISFVLPKSVKFDKICSAWLFQALENGFWI